MKEELGLFEERFVKPLKVAIVMLLAFLAGGFIPILAYFFVSEPRFALSLAAILAYSSLFVIGVWKTTFTHKHWLLSGLEMVFIGIIATLVPYTVGDLVLAPFLLRLLAT